MVDSSSSGSDTPLAVMSPDEEGAPKVASDDGDTSCFDKGKLTPLSMTFDVEDDVVDCCCFGFFKRG